MKPISEKISAIPDMNFVDYNVADVQEQLYTVYEQVTGKTLFPGNPERLFVDTLATALCQTRFDLDYGIKQGTLKYARGDALDHLGALVGCIRLPARSAKTRMEIVRSGDFGAQQIHGVGLRFRVEDDMIFETDTPLVFDAGESTAQVDAVAVHPGQVCNGLLPGQINMLVDQVPDIVSVVNINVSRGGADLEADEPFRERIALAPYGFSTTAPPQAAAYHARSVSQNIVDVAVSHPGPGRRNVYLLMAGGEMPSDEVLSDVSAVLNGDDKRPGTLETTVLPPVTRPFDVGLSWWIRSGQSFRREDVFKAVDEKVDNWIRRLGSRLGQAIVPGELLADLHSLDGVARVEILHPGYQPTAVHELPAASTVELVFKGVAQ